MTALKRPPGLATRPGYLNMLVRQIDPPDFYLKLARKYGDVVYFRFGPIESYLVSHPDLIRDVFITEGRKFGRPVGAKLLRKFLLGNGLLTSEGEFHLRQRRLMQPAFHRQRIAGYAKVMGDYAQRTSARWETRSEIDIAAEMMELTLSVVGKTLFDADVEQEAPEVGASFLELLELFDHTVSPLHIMLDKIGIGIHRRQLKNRDHLNQLISQIIQERRRRLEDRGDLLSMLLMTRDEEGGTGGMTDEQVRDEVMTLFLAGHETTALALTWMWYLISQHPDVEKKLHQELDTVLAGRAATFDDLPNLQYTEMIMAETLRLYPPAWLLGRGVLEECEIGGYRIPARSTVVLSPYVVHRDARFYPDPLRFDPERWTPEARAARPKFAYFPFGGGNRVCIGESFAWTEGILLLATLAQHWRLSLLSNQKIETKALITLRPRFGMRMKLARR